MDIFDTEKRSLIMSRIKSKGTRPELIVFSYLRKRNVYFQKHYLRAPGKPDIALPRKKRAVFIDGDFWHGRNFEETKKKWGNNNNFWINKISQNIERDLRQEAELTQQGWVYIRVWTSDITRLSTRSDTLKYIENFLTS